MKGVALMYSEGSWVSFILFQKDCACSFQFWWGKREECNFRGNWILPEMVLGEQAAGRTDLDIWLAVVVLGLHDSLASHPVKDPLRFTDTWLTSWNAIPKSLCTILSNASTIGPLQRYSSLTPCSTLEKWCFGPPTWFFRSCLHWELLHLCS